jgi:hypothetical protein
LLLIGREGAEETVNRQTPRTGLARLGKSQAAAPNRHIQASRGGVNMIRPQDSSLAGFGHRHLCVAREKFGREAARRGAQVLQDNEGEATIGTQMMEELHQRLESSRGSSYRDDAECGPEVIRGAVRAAPTGRCFLGSFRHDASFRP